MADLIGKTIDELPEDTSLTGSELFPVMDGLASKKIALSTLRGQFMMAATGTTLPQGTNIDEVLEPGSYTLYLPYITGGTPPPATYGCKMFVVHGFMDSGTARTWQIAYEMNPTCREYRRYHGFSGWSDWVTVDVDSINTKITALGNGNVTMSRVTVANGASGSLEVPGNYSRGILFFASSAANARGIYVLMSSSTGAVSAYPIVAATGITLTGGTNTLTIENGTSYYAYGLFIRY